MFTQKNEINEDQVLIQILLNNVEILCFLAHEGGTPQKHFCAEISFLL